MCVTKNHEEMNLHHEDGMLREYDKTSTKAEFNGYEAGTSIVEKSVVLEHGSEGVWSCEETVYSALSSKAAVHLDNTPFWDMGTPERLELLEQFLKETTL